MNGNLSQNQEEIFKQKAQLAYKLAEDYLLSFRNQGITPELLEKYLHLSETKGKPDSIEEIYIRLLESAKNANMKQRVVKSVIGDDINVLSKILIGFNPNLILERYQDNWQTILDEIERDFNKVGKIRETNKSIWPKYCQTIISAAEFLSQFSDANEFYRWADFFDQDDRSRAALPILLREEIKGFGFALSCDFLKELGYTNFAKPDVHIKDIFEGLGFCPEGTSDYHIFKTVVRVAKCVGVSPYSVDKIFWLIGSHYFYDDKNLGNEGRVAKINKWEFIEMGQKILSEFNN